jgi:ABC-type branched-subunit amino acid transport system permease subunit
MSALAMFIISVSLAATAARGLVKLSKVLPLALSLYFGAGAYAAAIVCNQTGTLGDTRRVLLALAVAIVVAVILSTVNMIAHRVGLRGDFYALFSLAYGYGLWYLVTFVRSDVWDVPKLTADGVGVEEMPTRLVVEMVAIGALAVTLLVERYIERSAIGEALRWFGDGVTDQRIYGLRSEHGLMLTEVWAAVGCGLGGALSTLSFGTAFRVWGEPLTLVVILVATLCSFTSWPVSVVLGAAFACALRPLLEDWLPAAFQTVELGVFGLVLYAFAIVRHRWDRVAGLAASRGRRSMAAKQWSEAQ